MGFDRTRVGLERLAERCPGCGVIAGREQFAATRHRGLDRALCGSRAGQRERQTRRGHDGRVRPPRAGNRPLHARAHR